MSNISEKPFGQYDILLKNGSGHLFSASVELGCRDWNDERGSPICYGASRKMIVSGMALEMGLGLKVYKTELGSYPTRSDLVYIFATGEDVEPVSVEVQEEFHRQWLESIRKE